MDWHDEWNIMKSIDTYMYITKSDQKFLDKIHKNKIELKF